MEVEIDELNELVLQALERHAEDMIKGLEEKGYWDSGTSVFPPEVCKALRGEVDALWHKGYLEKSKSARGDTHYYKKNVFATEVDGSKYDTAPRLCNYTVTTTKALAPLMSRAFPETKLSPDYIGNKINLCAGQGAYFDAHLDIGVGEKPFNRKLTLLIYLNNHWTPEMGGEITLLGEGATEEEAAANPRTAEMGLPVSIAPLAGRWLLFWGDKMLHKVAASFAPGGEDEYRVSYTIWFCTVDPPSVVPGTFPSSDGYEKAPDFLSF